MAGERRCLLYLSGCGRVAMHGDDLCEVCALHFRLGHLIADRCACGRRLRSPMSFHTRTCWKCRRAATLDGTPVPRKMGGR